MKERLTEAECWALFERLFPTGLDDRGFVEALAPQGWDRSPFLRVYHPTAEQIYEETLRISENLKALVNEPLPRSEEWPLLTLDDVRRDMQDTVSKPVEECADLLGACLWDVFSDNHEVTTADRALVDLGSFRMAATFIACFRYGRGAEKVPFDDIGDYIRFYMGALMLQRRADLTPVYELIFHRMRSIGLDWRYVHPRLFAVDLSALHELEEEGGPESYDPTRSFWRERELQASRAERAEFQRTLDDACRASIEQARRLPPPPTVRAYQLVYGHDPEGWPPAVETEA